jgi:hypothetical protein
MAGQICEIQMQRHPAVRIAVEGGHGQEIGKGNVESGIKQMLRDRTANAACGSGHQGNCHDDPSSPSSIRHRAKQRDRDRPERVCFTNLAKFPRFV